MKNKIIVFVFLLLFLPLNMVSNESVNADTNSPISSNAGGLGKVWEIEKSGSSGEAIVVQGGYIYTFGKTNDYIGDLVVIKWNLNGSLVWEKVFDDSLFEDRTVWDFSGDGEGLYVAGYQPGDEQGFLVKLNQSGDIVWDIGLNHSRFSVFASEEIVLTGGYGSIIEINSTNGAFIKQYYLPGESGFENYLLFEKDGDIYSANCYYLDNEYFFRKYNSAGDILWNISNVYASDIWVNENLYLLSGTRILKLSLEGDLLWNITVGDSIYRKFVADEEGFYIVGSTDSYKTELLLTRWNFEGGFVWEKSWTTKDYGDQSLYDAVFGENNTLYTLGSGSEIILTKWIKDEIVPTILDWTDMNCEQSDTTFLLYWDVYDENPFSYTISVNDSIIESGNWTSGTINYEVDLSAPLGQYNYSIVVEDLSGNIAEDSLIVTIEDTTIPTVRGLYADNGLVINWTATDRNPSTYIIYKDGEEISSGNWVSDGLISINIELPETGSYNYTIVFRDTSENICSSSVIVVPFATDPTETPTPTPPGTGMGNMFFLLIVFIIIMLLIIATIILIQKKDLFNNIMPRKKVYIER